MTAPRWVVALALMWAACGRGTPGLKSDLHTDSRKVTGTPGEHTAELVDAKPHLALEGVSGDVQAGVTEALAGDDLAKRGGVTLSFSGVPDAPSRSATLTITIEGDAVFAHLPQVSHLEATITGTVEYKNLDRRALGVELGKIALGWIHGEKLPATVGLPTAKPAPAKHVAVGSTSCSLHADASVRCWTAGETTPLPLPALQGTTAIAAAGNFGACGLRADGTAYCIDAWDNAVASEVRGVCGIEHATAIGVGDTAGCAIVDGGKVRCWARDPSAYEPCDKGTPAAEIAGVAGATMFDVGAFGGCVLDASGVKCWSHEEKTAKAVAGLAKSTTIVLSFSPCGAVGPAVTCTPLDATGGQSITFGAPVTKLATDFSGLCALTADGVIACADGTATTAVPLPGLANVTDFDADLNGGCVVLADGDVTCWDGNGGDRSPPKALSFDF